MSPEILLEKNVHVIVFMFTHRIAVHEKHPEGLPRLILQTQEEGVVAIEVVCPLEGRQRDRVMDGWMDGCVCIYIQYISYTIRKGVPGEDGPGFPVGVVSELLVNMLT